MDWFIWKKLEQKWQWVGLYDIAKSLDKQYVLIGYHSFVKSRVLGRINNRCLIIVIFEYVHIQNWIQQNHFMIGFKINLNVISILQYFYNFYLFNFLKPVDIWYHWKIEYDFDMSNIIGEW